MPQKQYSIEAISTIYQQPFLSLVFEAQTVHRQHFQPDQVQMSSLLSIKTGACPEDCGYCPQSGHHNTDLEKERLLDIDAVLTAAQAAKDKGASRFCMGAAWRSPPKKAMPKVMEMVQKVKEMGLETCMTLGMLDDEDASALKEAGLDYYNHNLDTSPEYYKKIITTRCYQDRLDTLDKVRQAGIKVCCGGITGLGETRQDRVSFLHQLANLSPQPESLPINRLIAFKGTPLEGQEELDPIEFVRTIATARIIMPTSHVRLSAGRKQMSDELQALCFLAGANSIHMGEKLLTADNPTQDTDQLFMQKLGLSPQVC